MLDRLRLSLSPKDGVLRVFLFEAYPFTRAELALAAGSYLGKITPRVADDATVALRAIVELLPIACDEFFAQVSLACPFCQAKAVGTAPIFSTAVTWKSEEWVDLKTTLEKATPFVSSSPKRLACVNM